MMTADINICGPQFTPEFAMARKKKTSFNLEQIKAPTKIWNCPTKEIPEDNQHGRDFLLLLLWEKLD